MGLDLEHDGGAAHEALLRGIWGDASMLAAAAARASGDTARAWSLAFAAGRALLVGGEPPSSEALASVARDRSEVRAALREAAPLAALAALVRLDPEEVCALAPLWRELAGDERARAVCEATLALASGDLAAASRCARGAASARPGDAIVASCLLALASDDAAEARDAARRAARSAREAGLRAHSLLASVVLARVRRRSGRADLAARILGAVRPLLPPVYGGWLAWELTLAGHAPPDDGVATLAPLAAQLVRAAQQGDRRRFDEVRAELLARAEPIAFLAPEAAALAALLDPALDPASAPAPTHAFLRGDEHEIPFGLGALDASDTVVAYVLRAPSRPPRRVLAAGAPLAGAARLPLTRMKKGRADLGLAVLALASHPLGDEDLFRACYDFRFSRHLHESVLSMLVSRMRARGGDRFSITRADGRVELLVTEGVLVPDPRCVASIERRLLALIARLGAVSTARAARELGVGLRVIQEAVAQLADLGLVMDRSGRSIRYRLRDSTFTTPSVPEVGP